MITHYMEEAIEADRIIVMDDGRIVMDGQPREIFSRVKELKSHGLDVPQVMGSRATGVQNKVGGLEGRKLAKGDEIGFRAPQAGLANMDCRVSQQRVSGDREHTLRVILGPQDDAFTPAGIATFLGQPYSVTHDFDRMGCRLDGPVIEH